MKFSEISSVLRGIPFISGKDSLHNQFTNSETGQVLRIPNTLLISAIAVIDDVRRCVTMDLQNRTARVVLVPSSSGGDSRLQGLAGQLGIPGLSALAGLRGGNSGQTVAAIVNSKAVRDSVGERARQAGHTTLSPKQMERLLKSGAEVDNDLVNRSITVEVTTRDPRLSQRLAAAFPDAVNAIATSIAIEAATHKRSTVERQIEVARQNLQVSQRALLEYQERTGTPQIQEQARQTRRREREMAAAMRTERGMTLVRTGVHAGEHVLRHALLRQEAPAPLATDSPSSAYGKRPATGSGPDGRTDSVNVGTRGAATDDERVTAPVVERFGGRPCFA